ncbi:glycerol kinase GlpK [Spongiibacter sp.]|jgi:glycerol kinase|uniref:glycerol kinase GlpK n=1 Tax=Spongiibacter sp. TaxID=2024860 RepID=UPI000C44B91B|nr:glycerol kinase GlpK [Spongiibacter sp.]MBU72973.1 glycerol kinase [Spongiibacter sp.]HCP21702.1 glycerol kinase [Marinobacter nauticus]|tara:strand:- start:14940 stop:16412 length:1473 start_codon:yes stop_codon:yes gene_type:complete
MTQYILSIDQGTTSSRAILFDLHGNIHATRQQEFPQHFPGAGWVEHSADDIWNSVVETCHALMTEECGSNDEVIAAGITNQRETTLVWDRKTGEPVYNAIVWQDRRTASYCESLKSEGLEPWVSGKTGLLVDPYFSATKIRWLLDNIAGARERAEKGELAFGTVDSFLLWRLTNGQVHRTDATNASRTLLFNIHTQEWDKELLELFGIPESMLPEVMDSAADFGQISLDGPLKGISVMGVAGDQQAALFGQTCFETGMAKSTYGTGCFLMLNTGDQALQSEHRLLTTVAYRVNGKPTYALEGSIFIAGATIQWLRDGLRLIRDACETEPLAEGTPVDHGVYLVPAFTGLGAPYWDPNARGAIFGLTRDTGIKEIVTAGLQSVCYQTKDLQKAMEKDGVRPTTLRVDGGMVTNNWVLQFLADILGARVDRPSLVETTALGAAYLAGLQVGVYGSLEELAGLWRCDRSFEPVMAKDNRDELYDGWIQAVQKL